MDDEAFREMLANEADHWWYRGRRDILRHVIARHVGRVGRVLEIGCGTGSNLEMLSAFGDVTGLEISPFARLHASARGFSVHDGILPDGVSSDLNGFDLICMFDVLEHISDPASALRRVRQMLAERGRLVVSVPAYQWLWSTHDERLEHKRRYTRSALVSALEDGGYRVRWSSYFNSLLFAPAAAVRMLMKVFPSRALKKESVGSAFANAMLYRIFQSEASVLGLTRFPVGLSIVAVAEK